MIISSFFTIIKWWTCSKFARRESKEKFWFFQKANGNRPREFVGIGRLRAAAMHGAKSVWLILSLFSLWPLEKQAGPGIYKYISLLWSGWVTAYSKYLMNWHPIDLYQYRCVLASVAMDRLTSCFFSFNSSEDISLNSQNVISNQKWTLFKMMRT
jgi:hypothetical protein